MRISIFLVAVIVIALAFIGPAHAQLGRQSFGKANFSSVTIIQAEIDSAETEFSRPGLLPGHPLYILKRLGERLQLIFANDEQKSQLHLTFAKIRLAETRKLVEQNKTEQAKSTINEFNKEIIESSEGIGKNISSVVKEREDILVKSALVLSVVLEKAPKAAKPAIEHALNNSIEASIRIKIERHRRLIEGKPGEKEEGRICVQVITSARNPETGEVRDFSTPCDVPEGWIRLQEEIKGLTETETSINTGGSSPVETNAVTASQSAQSIVSNIELP